MSLQDKTPQLSSEGRDFIEPEALSGPTEARPPLPRRETRDSTRSRPSGSHSPQDEAPTPDAPAADTKTARQKIAALLWRSVPSSTDEEAKERTEQLLDEHRAEVLHEGAAVLERIADEAEARVAAHFGPASGIGPGSAEMVREDARTLRAVAAERHGQAIAAAAPDFFQPGHAYTHRDGSTFRCVAVTTHPDGGARVALGWHTDTADWTFVGVRNINHWNHEYDGVQAPAEAGEVSA